MQTTMSRALRNVSVRRVVLSVLCAALTLTGVTGCSSMTGEPTVAAQDSSDGHAPTVDVPLQHRWRGTVNTTVMSWNSWLVGGYEVTGTFWFNVDDDGGVHGYANLAYHPRVNLDGANAILGYAESIEASTIGAVGGVIVPWLATVSVNRLFGFYYVVPNPMPTKSGPIEGSLDSHELRLHWVDQKQVKIPMKFYADYAKHDELLTHPSMSTRNPWRGVAKVTKQAGTLQAVERAHGKKTVDKGGTTTRAFSRSWSAHRVR